MQFLKFLASLVFVFAESDCKIDQTDFEVTFIHGSIIHDLSKFGIKVRHEGMNTTIEGHYEDGYSKEDKILVNVDNPSNSSFIGIHYTKNLSMKPVEQFSKWPLIFQVVTNGTQKFLIRIQSNTVMAVTPCEKKGPKEKAEADKNGKPGQDKKCVITVETPEVDEEICVCKKIKNKCYCVNVKPGLFELNDKIHNSEVCKFLEKFDEAVYTCSEKWIKGIKKIHEYLKCQEIRENIAEIFARECKIYLDSSKCQEESSYECRDKSSCEIIGIKEDSRRITRGIVSIMKASILSECLFRSSWEKKTCLVDSLRKLCLGSGYSQNGCKMFEMLIDVICFYSRKYTSPEYDYICAYEPRFGKVSPIKTQDWNNMMSCVESKPMQSCIASIVEEVTTKPGYIKPPPGAGYSDGVCYGGSSSGYTGEHVCGGYSGEHVCGGYSGEQVNGGYSGEHVCSGYTGEQVSGGYSGEQINGGYTGEQVNGGYSSDECIVEQKPPIPDFMEWAEQDHAREELLEQQSVSEEISEETVEIKSESDSSTSSEESDARRIRRKTNKLKPLNKKGSSNMGMIFTIGAVSVVGVVCCLLWWYLM